jgi:hypothetical protein
MILIFHHSKGLNYQNVSHLTSRIEETISDMLYCWVDKKGLICNQKKIFRVNCVDCLDRTNVIQSVISKHVLINQVRSHNDDVGRLKDRLKLILLILVT